MRVHVLDFNIRSIAAQLAHEDSVVQAKFLDTFLDELVTCCKSRYNAEGQLYYTNKDMQSEHKNLLEMFHEET